MVTLQNMGVLVR